MEKKAYDPSGPADSVSPRLEAAQALDEKHYGEVDAVLLYIEDARRRAERAARELREGGAEDFLVEALEQTQEELSALTKKLIQGTFYAVPKAQLSF